MLNKRVWYFDDRAKVAQAVKSARGRMIVLEHSNVDIFFDLYTTCEMLA